MSVKAGFTTLVVVATMAAAAQSASAVGISVAPQSELPSPASVNVSGFGFEPNTQVAIFECTGVFPGTVDCDATSRVLASTNQLGSFGPQPFSVSRTFMGDVTMTARVCEGVACYVRALGESPGGGSVSASSPISFGSCQGQPVTLSGTPERDRITGTPGPDVISALGGGDQVSGLGGNDVICGGPGKDVLVGGKGKDALDGGGGKDRCEGGRGDDSARCEVKRSI